MFGQPSDDHLTRAVTHVLPRLPPASDGVGDYLSRLREFWPQPEAAHWSYVVRSEAGPSRLWWPDARIEECETSSGKLLQALEGIDSNTAVLHYVGYGFHARGCPFWLARGLKEWKRRDRTRKAVVMFHELYALTPIWQTAFWLRPLAKKVISNLIQIADQCLTSCPQYREQLLREFKAPADKVRMIPVGANILPTEVNRPSRPWPLLDQAKLKVVVFGLGLTRIWALRAHTYLLRDLFLKGQLESITLLGKGGLTPKWAAHLGQLKARIAPDSIWKESYDLSSIQVSEGLSEFDLGLVSNWPGILTKSGVFAALSAHGILSVITQDSMRDATPSFPEAFFLNDDSPAGVKACSKEILDPNLVSKKRQTLGKFYREHLSWNNICLQWNNILLGL